MYCANPDLPSGEFVAQSREEPDTSPQDGRSWGTLKCLRYSSDALISSAFLCLLGYIALPSAPAFAQETAWPDPAPSVCVSIAFYESVVWERAYAKIDKLNMDALKSTGHNSRDCQRIFRWLTLERSADAAEVEQLSKFAMDIIAARRGEISPTPPPLACLQSALVGANNAALAKLPTESDCRAVGYWARISPPDAGSGPQERGRARFIADMMKELDTQQ